ncbi:hypothetical protein GCM10025787_21480 [Saccharopolyspora rosea]|uniref:DNA 3'-5' helicase n=1 Tax=Saccharopolyspora rosea TaxID=524884 RepID=A0ABW3FRM2_9PSEU
MPTFLHDDFLPRYAALDPVLRDAAGAALKALRAGETTPVDIPGGRDPRLRAVPVGDTHHLVVDTSNGGHVVLDVRERGAAVEQRHRDGADVSGTTDDTGVGGSRVVPIDDAEDLDEVLHRPFPQWRVFLHESQRRIAEHAPFRGPARVTGGAGTGKTVVAMHRAAHLARGLDLPPGSVLLTTFTKSLARDLEHNLGMLVPDRIARSRIDVTTVDSLARRLFRRLRGHEPDVLRDTEAEKRLHAVSREHGLAHPGSFLYREWRQIVLGQRLGSVEDYLAADRRGRGRTLPPAERRALWEVFRAFRRQLRAAGLRTFTEIADEVARELEGREDRPYRHVVVDEAQDLDAARWRMLRSAVAEGADDMFVVGDAHQRIYDNKISLRSLGIHVTGRSFKLRTNYRASREILLFSTALLLGERVDDMDEGSDDLTGYRSLLRGRPPRTREFPTERDELAAIVERVTGWLGDGVAAESIAVTARTNRFLGRVEEALRGNGIATAWLGEDRPGVRIGTMHKAKGLEFRCVAVADVGAASLPFPRAVTPEPVDPQQYQQDVQAERNLLFVACTRARDRLFVTWHGAPSPFLRPVLAVR